MIKRPKIGFWIRLAITVAAISFLCSRIDIREVTRAAGSVSLLYLAFALANNLFARYITAYQMAYAMRMYGPRYSVWHMFAITLRTLFYGFFLPGELTSAGIKWYLISRLDGLRAQTFASMTYIRLTQVILLFGMGLGAVMIEWPFKSQALLYLAWTVLAAMLIVTALLHTKTFRAILTRVEANALYRRLPHGVTQRLGSVFDAFGALSGITFKDALIIWSASLAFKLLVTVSFWFISRSLGVEIGFLTLIWINSVVELVQLLPISIAGLGPREASMVYMLRFYGVTDSVGLAFSLIIFVLRIATVLPGGVFVLKDAFNPGTHKPEGPSEGPATQTGNGR